MQDHTKPIHDTIGPSDDGLTSGFTESIDQERAVDSMSEEKGFGNVQEYYVSNSGPTRLFTATRYGKRYVLKCLKTDYLLTPVYQQAIAKEFEIGLLLEHPYICRTLAMEQLAGMGRTIVMEQVDGDTLQTLLSEKRLSPDLALRIASQTMDALDYMHSKQITHRDLKPSNIMVTHRGKNVKIIDFGLSDSDLFGVLKMPAGTYRYLAPEQLLQGAVADPKADIYSLGMVMEDMAEATGSKRLHRMARICTVKDVSLRPESIEALRRRLAGADASGASFPSSPRSSWPWPQWWQSRSSCAATRMQRKPKAGSRQTTTRRLAKKTTRSSTTIYGIDDSR